MPFLRFGFLESKTEQAGNDNEVVKAKGAPFTGLVKRNAHNGKAGVKLQRLFITAPLHSGYLVVRWPLDTARPRCTGDE